MFRFGIADTKDSERLRNFCLKMIKLEYNIDYTPEYHYDLDSLVQKDGMYFDQNGGLFVYFENETNGEIVATGGMRNLETKPKNFELAKKHFGDANYGSIWRVYVDRKYRKLGLATAMVEALESKAKELAYRKIYLHTDLSKPDVLRFWKNRSYSTFETERYVVHMIKDLA